MKSPRLAIFWLISLTGTYAGSASADIGEAWKSSAGAMAAALEPGEGFSFKYADKPIWTTQCPIAVNSWHKPLWPE